MTFQQIQYNLNHALQKTKNMMRYLHNVAKLEKECVCDQLLAGL